MCASVCVEICACLLLVVVRGKGEGGTKYAKALIICNPLSAR